MNKKALKIYKAELEKLKAKYERKLNAEIEKHNKKLEQLKEDYPDSNSIDIAYGYGIITSVKRDKLIKIFDNFEELKNYQSATGKLVVMLENDIKAIEINIKMEE
jgi:hypothetical protein